MAEPSVGDINSFIEFTGAERSLAIKFLKRYDTVETAANSYFENGGRLVSENATWAQAQTWDEQQFHGDRMFGPENNPANSFQVHSADNTTDSLQPGLFSATLSRPPSRADNAVNNREDVDMQQAISLSVSQTLDKQESGVTDQKDFRPAQRAYYDPNDWSLVSKPIMPNPEPEYRKRPEGAPAFMKPSPRGHFLPALLTILHEIPMAKEALLARDAILQDYGLGEEWWDGEPVRIRRVVLADSEGSSTKDVPAVIESQRIMAFLELTERAYGNVAVLGQLSETDESSLSGSSETVESFFLETWQQQMEAILPDNPFSRIFTSHPVNLNTSDPATEIEEPAFRVAKLYGIHGQQFEFLHIPKGTATLYDALDAALWGAHSMSSPDQMYLEFGEILTFVIEHNTENQMGNTGAINAPSVLYVDRYLKENVPKAREVLEEMNRVEERIKAGDDAQADFKSIANTRRRNETFDAKDLLKVVKPFFAGAEPSSDDDDSDQDLKGQYYHDLEGYKGVGETLQALADRVMAKFQALEEKKEQLKKEMREATTFFEEQSVAPGEPPFHPYTLRGVATDPNTTFVLANPNTTEDLIDTVLEDWQWWKITFDLGETQPISYKKVDIDIVQATIKNPETKKALLVYASEKAVAHSRQPLPSQLRNFVRADNLAFSEELEQSRRRASPGSFKRKVDEEWDAYQNKPQPRWGGDSPDSTTAQADDDNAPPLIDASLENSPPPYSQSTSNPPPVPPRNPALKRHAPAVDEKISSDAMMEDAIPDFTFGGEFRDIDLIGSKDTEMQEVSAPQAPVFGTGGAGNAATGSYASSIRMSDVEDLPTDPNKGNEDLMQL